MTKPIENRKEILFLYDAVYCNPNGDPSNENKPRIDYDTSINIVTDVRMKRTIRDYLDQIENFEIFVKSTYDDDNYLKDGKARARDFLSTDSSDSFQIQKDQINQTILDTCIDVRLFGAVIPLELTVKNNGKKESKKGSITHTGPVQFKMGLSMHKVNVERIKGTGAFASAPGKEQQSFRVEYVVPYSIISFYGIVNEYRAKETQLTEEDVEYLYKGMWVGTKHLITRSKAGTSPRILLVVEYKSGKFQISDLDQLIELESDKDDLAIRSTEDYTLNFTKLIETLFNHRDKIDRLRFAADINISVSHDGETFKGINEIVDILKTTGIETEELDFD